MNQLQAGRMSGTDLSKPRKVATRLRKALVAKNASEVIEIIGLLEQQEYDAQHLEAIRAFKAALSGEHENIETVRKILEEVQRQADGALIDLHQEQEKEEASLIHPWTEFREDGEKLPWGHLEWSPEIPKNVKTDHTNLWTLINSALEEFENPLALSKDKLFEQYCGEAVTALINREVLQDPSWFDPYHVGEKGNDNGVDYVIVCDDESSPTYGIILVQAKWLEVSDESKSYNFETSGLMKMVDFAKMCYSGEYHPEAVTNQNLEKLIGTYRRMLEEFRTKADNFDDAPNDDSAKEPRVPRIYLVTCASKFSGSMNARAKDFSAITLDFPLLEYLTNSADDSIAIPAPPKKFLRMSAHLVDVDDGDNKWGYDAYVGYANALQLVRGLYRVEKDNGIDSREPGLLYTNVRSRLSDDARAQKIRESLYDTVSEEPANFFAYNNGLTLVCKRLTFSPGRKFVTLEQPQLVNGGQTINALWDMKFGTANTEKNQTNLVDVKVPVKVITCENQDSLNKLRSQIARYSNDQNPTEQRDLVSNMPSMIARKSQFRKFKIYYETKRGGWDSMIQGIGVEDQESYDDYVGRSASEQKLENVEAAQLLWAMIGGGQPSSSKKSDIWDMATTIETHPLFSSEPVPLKTSQLQPGAQEYRLTGEEKDYITDVLFARYLQREILKNKQRNNYGKLLYQKNKSVIAIDPENPSRTKFSKIVSLQSRQNFMICLFNQTLRIFSELDGVKQSALPEEAVRVRRAILTKFVGDLFMEQSVTKDGLHPDIKTRFWVTFGGDASPDTKYYQNFADVTANTMDVFKPRELLNITLKKSTEETPAFQVASVLDMLHRAICETFLDREHDKSWYNGDISRILDNLDLERLNFMKFGGQLTDTRKAWEAALNQADAFITGLGLM